MGFLARLATLIKSNLNDLISRSEDPEKMLNQVLVDMRQQLVDAKKQVAVAIADEKRLKKQAEEEAQRVAQWENKAMLAVRAGDDDLARQALQRKTEHQQAAVTMQQQWESQREAVEKLKDALRTLNAKIEEAKRKKNILVARKKRAEAQKAIHETMAGLNDASAFETFDRMAGKIQQLEAEAEAGVEVAGELTGDTLEREFARLEAGKGTDAALLELKQKMGLLPGGTGQAAQALPAGQVDNAPADTPDQPADAVDAELEALKAKIGPKE
jgi:phage shock protein A